MTQHYDSIEMKVPAKPEYVGVIRLTVSGIANRIGYTYDDIEEIKIAVSEACSNVVYHAYQDQEGMISIRFEICSDHLKVTIADNGCSFDVDSFRERLSPVDKNMPVSELKEGGLGLYLIHSLMDHVEIIEDNGITLVMTKYIGKDGVERYVDEASKTFTQE